MLFPSSGKFLPGQSEGKKLAGSDKQDFFTYHPHSKGTILLYMDKIQIKKLRNYSASITM